MEADPAKRPIRKTRYCLTYDNQYFEIDVYPFWPDKAIVEIELSDENAGIHLPKELKIIKEVTDDPGYQNAALASIWKCWYSDPGWQIRTRKVKQNE